MLKQIFITYCSKRKVEYEDSTFKYLPSELYISPRVQEFISHCSQHNHTWAIFSDYYGLVFANEKIEWYDKNPDCVTNKEYERLLYITLKKLTAYDEVFFYYNIDTYHTLYVNLVNDLKKFKTVVLLDRLEVSDEQEHK